MDDDLAIEVPHETSREQNNIEDDQIRGWRGEPPVSSRRDPPTPVAGIQTSNRWHIVRVPSHVRVVDELAYTPKILSIGPIHHDAPSLKAMEAHKSRFLTRLQNEITSQNILAEIKDAMTNLESEARKCYSEEFDHINSNDFVQMLVLDACFIVEFLRLHEKACKGEDVMEPVFGTRWMLPVIGRDLLMLENQLPMFVIREIYNLTSFSAESEQTPLVDLALQLFETLRPFKDKLPSEISASKRESDISHLLGLFQASFVLSTDESSFGNIGRRRLNEYDRFPGKGRVNNATRLNFAGISFCPQSDDNFLTFELEHQKLKIPTLLLDDGTSPLLRNLLAYEQSNRYAAPYFTSLAVFMDSIVDTAKDVDILRNAGFIKQVKGGNDEIVDLLNSLTRELEFDINDCYYLSKPIHDINNFCRSFKARMLFSFRTVCSSLNFWQVLLAYISLFQTLAFVGSSGDKNNNSTLAPAPSPL
ncbi:hypothetical protein TIFTF001_036088 [Ficus carica]|uniref:Uncharacterized protein n=1 Tax=Ficus carica TaxID=3494 RepID=A0AA88E312_FICCA|nr:hypothetical protein TIFTF001_036084 [Ficus carica]GMN67029.1 hypothetical protein TIFTF001_036088 [Ficus carica]